MQTLNSYGESTPNLSKQSQTEVTTLYRKTVTNQKQMVRPRTYTKEIHTPNGSNPVLIDHQIPTRDFVAVPKIPPKSAQTYPDSKKFKNRQNSVMAELTTLKNELKMNKHIPKMVSKQLKLPPRMNTIIPNVRPVSKAKTSVSSAKDVLSSTTLKHQEITKNLALYFRKKEIEQKYTNLRPPSAISIVSNQSSVRKADGVPSPTDTIKSSMSSRQNTMPLDTRRPISAAKVVYSLPVPAAIPSKSICEKTDLAKKETRPSTGSSGQDSFYECENGDTTPKIENDEIIEKNQLKSKVNTRWEFETSKSIQRTLDKKPVEMAQKYAKENSSVSTSTTTFPR